MRETAAFALERIGDTRVVEPLNAALRDGNEGVREAAARALENLRRGADGRLVIGEPPAQEDQR